MAHVGTRGSRLARAQTAWVIERLREAMPDRRWLEVLISTAGDQSVSVALGTNETTLVGVCGLLAGIGVGVGMGTLLVHVLQPLFILAPPLVIPPGRIAVLAGLAVAAILASSFAASLLLRRLRATELLRET